MRPEAYFRRKILIAYEAPHGTDDVRREILDDTMRSFVEMRPKDDEAEPAWMELIRTYRGKKWPLAVDLARALNAVREHRREIGPSTKISPGTRKDADDSAPLTPQERYVGSAFWRMFSAYRAEGRTDELLGLTGEQLGSRAVTEGYGC